MNAKSAELKWKRTLNTELDNWLKRIPNSPAHEKGHITRVWENVKKISETLDGDMEVLIAATYFHDLARHEKGEGHGKVSAMYAKPLLSKINFPKEKIDAVLKTITEHEDEEWYEREAIESKILFDADKLDAFGVIGVFRHIMYYHAHRGKSIEDTCKISLKRLDKRWKGLHTETAKRIGKGDYEYAVNYFTRLSELI